MAKRNKVFLTVYTVSEHVMVENGTIAHDCLGSFIYRGDAIKELADHIVDQMEDSLKLRRIAIEDTDHEIKDKLVDAGVSDELIDRFFDNPFVDYFEDKIREVLVEYISDVLGSESCYVIGDSRYDIDENDVECRDGLKLWTCITSGRDDECHDREFEDPFPEVFFFEKDAVDCAIRDLKSYLGGYSKKAIQNIVNSAKDRIKKDGRFELYLNDSKIRIWDIWSTPIDIGQGCPVKRTMRR